MHLIGIEPTHAAPEATALSTELQMHRYYITTFSCILQAFIYKNFTKSFFGWHGSGWSLHFAVHNRTAPCTLRVSKPKISPIAADDLKWAYAVTVRRVSASRTIWETEPAGNHYPFSDWCCQKPLRQTARQNIQSEPSPVDG